MVLQSRGPLIALLVIALSVSPFASAVPVSGQGTWETTLESRDLDGNAATVEAYYDTVLNITWLANANLAQTSGFDADGLLVWATVNPGDVAVVPAPAAVWLLGTGLAGFVGIARKRRR